MAISYRPSFFSYYVFSEIHFISRQSRIFVSEKFYRVFQKELRLGVVVNGCIERFVLGHKAVRCPVYVHNAVCCVLFQTKLYAIPSHTITLMPLLHILYITNGLLPVYILIQICASLFTVDLQPIVTSTLIGGDWLVSRFGRFNPMHIR